MRQLPFGLPHFLTSVLACWADYRPKKNDRRFSVAAFAFKLTVVAAASATNRKRGKTRCYT